VNRAPTENELSAGGVLWRPAPGKPGVEICLIATRGSTRWQLPKGHMIDGESLAEAARREVREETGCDGELEDDLGSIHFWFFVGVGLKRRRVKKTVQFYLLRYRKGETRDHDGEVDEAAWIVSDQALRRLTFESERNILVKALEVLRGREGVGS
jgi:8-oxo-dGTP pyrophosphatase MutT (NUDIX family)